MYRQSLFLLILVYWLAACTADLEPIAVTRVLGETAVPPTIRTTATVPATAVSLSTPLPLSQNELEFSGIATIDPAIIPTTTPTVTPEFTNTATAVPTATENAIPITATPVVRGGNVLLLDWSVDSRYLAYFEYSEEELRGQPYYLVDAEGTFTIYDPINGTKCQDYLVSGRSDYEGLNLGRRHVWLPNGDLFVLASQGNAFQVAMPCQEQTQPLFTESFRYIATVSPDQSTLVLVGSGYWLYNWQEQSLQAVDPEIVPLHETLMGAESLLAWSPNGRYLAITSKSLTMNPVDGTWSTMHETWIVETATGATLSYQDGYGIPDPALGIPTWLNETEIIVGKSEDYGLFFMTVAGELRPLLPLFPMTLSELPPSIDFYANSDSYHILLGYAGTNVPIQIYHSDTGEVETLAEVSTIPEVLPNGKIVINSGEIDLLTRDITAVGEPFIRTPFPCYVNSEPNKPEYVAQQAAGRYIHVQHVPDCNLVASLDLGGALGGSDYVFTLFAPNNEWLAIVPTYYSGGGYALFVLPLADILP